MKNIFGTSVSAFMLLLLIFSCGSTQGQSEITVVDADRLLELQSEGAVVIDVRSPEEVAEGKIPGAINIPISDNMTSEMTNIDKDKAVVVYCRSGGRSTNASEILSKAGYKVIYNYKGSMNDWQSKKKPVE